MAITNDSLPEIIKDIKNRLYKLELANYTYGDVTQDGRVDLNINGLTSTVVYYDDAIGNQRAQVTFSWNAINNNDPDNLESDPAVDYMFSLTRSTDASTGLFSSTRNQTTVTLTNLPLGINVTGRVYAVSQNGINGNIASNTVVVTKDLTPPPQPSVPVLTARPGGVSGTYDGKDSLGQAMSVDFSHCVVQTSLDNVTFSSVDIVSANSSFFVSANTSYSKIYVRYLSVDKSGNVNTSTPSTVANATPLKVTSSDMDVVLPGSKAYSDVGNWIIDGSFENPSLFTKRNLSVGSWSYDTTAGMAFAGNASVKLIGDGTASKYLYLQRSTYSDPQLSGIQVMPDAKYYVSALIRSTGANGTHGFLFTWYKQDGTQLSTSSSLWQPSISGIYDLYEAVVQAPNNAVELAIAIHTANQTTGTVWFDAVQFKPVITSSIIEDGAITRAKIGLAAITTAQIEAIDAGVIKSGFISGDRIQANTINTSHIAIGAIQPSDLADTVGSQLNITGNPSVTDKATNAVVNTINTSVTSLTNSVNTLTNSVIIDGSGVTINKQGSPFQITIDNNSLNFKENGTVIAYINGQKMYIKSAEIKEQLTVGVHVIEKYDTNNTFIRWIG